MQEWQKKDQEVRARYPVQFMIRITPELRDKLAKDCIKQDRSMSYVARRLLEEHYSVDSRKKRTKP